VSTRHISAKRAWARISERAEHGEKFGFIACLGILYKGGLLTRGQVLERLKEARITRADLEKFREHIGHSRDSGSESGQVCGELGNGLVSNSRESARSPATESVGKEPHAFKNVFELPLRP
jgi:hypothetical protein